MSSELLIVIGVVAAAAAGTLVDWLVRSMLPENPRGWRYVAITVVIILALVAVATLAQRRGPKDELAEATPSPGATSPAPTPTWPVSETGVEACHLSSGQLTYSRKNAELWSTHDPVNGERLAKLNQETRIKILDAPTWAPLSAKAEDSGWWFKIEILADARQGWVVESSIEGCLEP